MENGKAIIFISILLGLLTISVGGNIVQANLEPTGEKIKCYSGWELQIEGENTGKYGCQTASGTRYQYCSGVEDTKNGSRQNFYCYVANMVVIETLEPAEHKESIKNAQTSYFNPDQGSTCEPLVPGQVEICH